MTLNEARHPVDPTDSSVNSAGSEEGVKDALPLAYVLAEPLPQPDETYTHSCVPTIIAGCAKDD